MSPRTRTRRRTTAGPIIVMPDINGSITGDTECVDGTRGNAESYLTKDVRDAVVATYSTASDAKRWAIGGLSEGGYCAFMLGVRHPDLWTTFVDLSGLNVPSPGGTTAKKLLRGNEAAVAAHSPLVVLQQPNAAWRTLGGWFAVGAQDAAAVVDAVQAAAAAAQDAGVQTELRRSRGSHLLLLAVGHGQGIPVDRAAIGLAVIELVERFLDGWERNITGAGEAPCCYSCWCPSSSRSSSSA